MNLAQEGGVHESEWKLELFHKLNNQLQRAVMREAIDEGVEYSVSFASDLYAMSDGFDLGSVLHNKANGRTTQIILERAAQKQAIQYNETGFTIGIQRQ